ncbi:MAG: hypothetical protein SNJ56_04035 [Termitinemataceae bacterium]
MEQANDEISLVDILVVLLKHWKMIVILPVVTAVAVLGMSVLKKDSPSTDTSGVVESYAQITLNPLLRAFADSANLVNYITDFYLKDVDLLYAALRKSDITFVKDIALPQEADKSKYIIKNLLIDGKDLNGKPLQEDDTPYKVAITGNIITVTVRFIEKNKSQMFLEELLTSVAKKSSDFLLPVLTKEIQDYEKLLLEGKSGAANLLQNTLAIRYPLYSAALFFVNNQQQSPVIISPIQQIEAPVKDPKFIWGTSKIVIIGFVAALFCAVFLAFVLEAIDNVRKDSEAMAKIRSALKKG